MPEIWWIEHHPPERSDRSRRPGFARADPLRVDTTAPTPSLPALPRRGSGPHPLPGRIHPAPHLPIWRRDRCGKRSCCAPVSGASAAGSNALQAHQGGRVRRRSTPPPLGHDGSTDFDCLAVRPDRPVERLASSRLQGTFGKHDRCIVRSACREPRHPSGLLLREGRRRRSCTPPNCRKRSCIPHRKLRRFVSPTRYPLS